jgi:hypothetical protein
MPATVTAEPTATPTLTPTATPCPPDLCTFAGWLVLQRPIAPPGNDAVDVTYRFGSTQGGLRDPHHGVEFLNGFGTPVLAAGAGTVLVAGNDLETLYSPYYNFYGNLVVIEHALPDLKIPLYTLYAHLSEVLVQPGQVVQSGQEIGKVGMSGGATGSHLHFEVRLGENSYGAACNPELWLAPHPGQEDQPVGAIAGRLLLPAGFQLDLPNIVLELLDGRDGPPLAEYYTGAYEEAEINSQPPWGETFAASDLPAGWYRITFYQNGMQTRQVQVLPGQITLVTFDLRSP